MNSLLIYYWCTCTFLTNVPHNIIYKYTKKIWINSTILSYYSYKLLHWCNFLIAPFYTELSIIHCLYTFRHVVTNSFLPCLIPQGFSLYWIKTLFHIYKTPIHISCFVSQVSMDYSFIIKILLAVLFPSTKWTWNFVNTYDLLTIYSTYQLKYWKTSSLAPVI